MSTPPVSIVVPAYNAEEYIHMVLDGIFNQSYQGEIEVIVVNDGSTDRTRELAESYPAKGELKIINQENQGATAATNNGISAARHGIICSVDSDVVLHRDWMDRVIEEFSDPGVGAVQGYYRTPPGLSFWARMMGYDVEARYDSIKSKLVTHVCTGDTAYRKSALDDVGLFDTSFTYGYDNNMSYRLQNHGYKLIFRRDAVCDHYWKASLKGYVKQQYRSAYGRMQLVRKHRERIAGDSVSGLRMIMQAPLSVLFLSTLILSIAASLLSNWGRYLFILPAISLAVVLADRIVFAAGVYRKQRDASVALMPLVHLLRNTVWSWALISWALRPK